MGHKIKERKPECPHLHTKTKTTSTTVSTICKDCGATLTIDVKGSVDKNRERRKGK